MKEGPCPPDMVHVAGKMVAGDSEYIEALQDLTCVRWINKNYPPRCDKFDEGQWKKRLVGLKRVPMDFCIDRYEWPDREGERPRVMVNWLDSGAECQRVGKKLCTEEEWSFACEGEEALPYPYGYSRDPGTCNIDQPWTDPDEGKLWPIREESWAEVERLWRGDRSGERQTCVSPFGVRDMTGNVDEWTTSTRSTGHRSILKGGYWSVVRNRCRPATRIHNEWHVFYQQGFRCCKATNPAP